jgi:hypothetical protein
MAAPAGKPMLTSAQAAPRSGGTNPPPRAHSIRSPGRTDPRPRHRRSPGEGRQCGARPDLGTYWAQPPARRSCQPYAGCALSVPACACDLGCKVSVKASAARDAQAGSARLSGSSRQGKSPAASCGRARLHAEAGARAVRPGRGEGTDGPVSADCPGGDAHHEGRPAAGNCGGVGARRDKHAGSPAY